jgi:VCBS repeat-containing protein
VSVAVGDFNGDGDADLVAADQSPGEVMVLLGGSGGTFTGPNILTLDSGLSAVAVADFNLDGDPDLAVTNVNLSRVSVLRGDTGAAFTGPTSFTVGSGPTSEAVGDFNGDGKPDLTVTNFNNDNVSVLLNSTVTNRAPVATDDAYSTAEDTILTVAAPGVLTNDSDPDGNPLTAVLVSGPSHGTLTLNGTGSFSYTPATDFAGSDSFSYRASDGTLTSNPATVTISVTAVNDAPTAAGEAYSTAEDTALTVAPPGVLANDTDPDGEPLTAVLESVPSHGTLTLNTDGSFTYTPAAEFTGSDSFTYRASDGTLTSNPATVTLTVAAVNDTPTVTVTAGGTCGSDDRSGTINLTVGDVDSAATSLALSASSSNSMLLPDGNIMFAGGGATRTVTVRTVSGRTGTAVVTITVSDGQATGTFQLTVRAGGKGGDTVTGDGGVDLIMGQGGNDTLSGADGNDLLCGGDGKDFLSGGVGDDTLFGASEDDVLNGDDGIDLLDGGPGKDTLSGGAGDDTLIGAGQDDVLNGDDGIDLLDGGDGKDTLSGGAGDDTLIGAGHDDRLTGGPGADRFSGGPGNDKATDYTVAEGDTTDGTIP